jgi:DNA-binding NarL/FixJ family response regulator
MMGPHFHGAISTNAAERSRWGISVSLKPAAAQPKSLATEAKQSKSQKFLQTYTADAEDTRKIQSLTTRELEVIRQIALGLKNKDIANRLSISDITVRHHLTSLFFKLEVADRQKLLILAYRYGLAELTLRAESAWINFNHWKQ